MDKKKSDMKIIIRKYFCKATLFFFKQVPAGRVGWADASVYRFWQCQSVEIGVEGKEREKEKTWNRTVFGKGGGHPAGCVKRRWGYEVQWIRRLRERFVLYLEELARDSLSEE